MVKFSRIASIIILSALLCAYKPLGLIGNKVRTVIVDAGHGGHDAGCMYGGAKEKEVTLQVALK
ncbi:MAG: N-acetylmuramoyl-L-alanine amidase, partial [Bacteroidota bacterium]